MIFLIDAERKDGIFVVRSDARVGKTGSRKHELLITNAVAVSYLVTALGFSFCCLVWDQWDMGFAWCL